MPIMAKPWKHPDSGIYYHRVEVPADIRDKIGKRWIKTSLRTKDFREAKRLFASQYAETQSLFEQARAEVSLLPKDIEVLAQRWLDKSIAALEDDGDFQNYLMHSDDQYSSASGLIADALERGYKQQKSWVKQHVNEVLNDHNLLILEDSPDYQALTERMCWRLMELSKIAENRFYGDWSSASPDLTRLATHRLSTESEKVTPVSAQTDYKPLGEMVSAFLNYKIDRGDWELKTRRDAENASAQFVEFIGADIDPNTITRDQIRDFVTLLLSLPQRYTMIPRLKTKSLNQLVEIAAEEDLQTVSPTTAKKKLVFIKSLFKHAVQEEWIDRNRTEGIQAPKGKPRQRVAYTPEQANVLLDATKVAVRPSDYWCPRIALTMGMRSNEILQVTKDDIKQLNGIWCIDINRGASSETGTDKKAKNENSERVVPVPEVLIEAGFIKYVDHVSEGRIFPCVKLGNDGTYSLTYSKRVNPLIRKLGLKPEPDEMVLRDFHSLRHTFRANARAYGVPKEYADLIGGWKDQSEKTAGDSYGLHFESFICELKSNLDKIDYTKVGII